MRYCVKLTCKSLDVQWHLPEQTVPEDCHVVYMAGGHPEKPSTIWKEVLIFKEQMCCQVFGVETQGRCKYRVLEFTTDMRFAERLARGPAAEISSLVVRAVRPRIIVLAEKHRATEAAVRSASSSE